MALELTHGSLIWGARYASVGWRDYTGVPVDRWSDAVVPDDLAHCTQALADAQRLGHPIGCEARLRSMAGDGRWFRLVFVPAGGDGWYACAHDIEERFTAERARRWITTVSHELRTPVTTMLLWERVLRDPDVTPERHAQALEAIHDCASAQSRIVEDLVQLARSTTGALRVELRRIDLGSIVHAAVAAAALAGTNRQVAVTADVPDEPAAVRGDTQRLRQILDNVLVNSLKFSREGGTIVVAVRATDSVVRVSIRDDGEGISPSLLPYVFEPFTGTGGGLGLGLAIARELTLLHRGSLEAVSAGPGHGATFTLTLPLARTEEVETVEDARPSRRTSP